MKLNALEKRILAEMLEQAIQELSNNGCNDFMLEAEPGEEKFAIKLLKELNEEVGMDEDIEGDITRIKVGESVCLTDFVVLQFLRDKLLA